MKASEGVSKSHTSILGGILDLGAWGRGNGEKQKIEQTPSFVLGSLQVRLLDRRTGGRAPGCDSLGTVWARFCVGCDDARKLWCWYQRGIRYLVLIPATAARPSGWAPGACSATVVAPELWPV